MASGLVSVQSGSSGLLLFRYPLRCLLRTLASSSSPSGGGHAPSASSCSSSSSGSLRRNFFTSRFAAQWKNETPPGGLTELYVYRPENPRVWPDPLLGVFAPKDPRCCLPGNVGMDQSPFDLSQIKNAVSKGEDGIVNEPVTSSNSDSDVTTGQQAQHQQKDKVFSSDLFTRFTAKEHQAQTLHSACDYLQHTAQAEANECCDILEAFPEIGGMSNLDCQLREAPSLLKKELQGLFPGRDVIKSQLSVITMARKTENDMTGWSGDVEDERENLVETFITAAKEICGRLHGEGYWADFIDPCSGKPYLGQHTNTTLFETDDRFRMLGFQIEDLGCCKVITHREFGRNVFVGTIFTDAHPATGVVQDLFEDMRVLLEGATSDASKTGNRNQKLFSGSSIPEFSSALDQDALIAVVDDVSQNFGGKS